MAFFICINIGLNLKENLHATVESLLSFPEIKGALPNLKFLSDTDFEKLGMEGGQLRRQFDFEVSLIQTWSLVIEEVTHLYSL